ncbi:MAG: phospho-N-acetylmuramoyl-pentapeptide-transferase [Cyclobacteriaceae bacterium]|nr:MAG: phospho-N-acetylmuramoyl-pentapeptide-transferase [Cyclobacteriaceae bacterium]
MFYYLFDFLDREYDLIGAGVFQYLSFRAGMAVIVSLLITIAFGKRIINYLHRQQVGETVRDLGLKGQMEKSGTPTMGGLIIIAAILVPTILFAKLNNIYVQLLIVSVVWMGLVGFVDDYIKVFKKNKAGLKGRFKIGGQIGLGLIVGITLYSHPDVLVRVFDAPLSVEQEENIDATYKDAKSTRTTIPFVKNNDFDYKVLVSWLDRDLTWLVYILVVILAIMTVSNGANITDGIDGLAAGTSAIIALALGIFAYLSSNMIWSEYLNIMYLPSSEELVIFCTALVGAAIGFLWYNSFPAQVFMGDTGSLTLGAVIAVLALALRKELLIPVLCGIFILENVSVVMQVFYFKYTRKKYGEGRRIFKMAPLHHHYQMEGYHESKIATRFWLIGVLLAVFSLATLKLR